MLTNMMRKTKLFLVAAVTLCLIGLGGAGVALADSSPNAAPPPGPSPTQPAPQPPPPAPPPPGKHHPRIQHGEFTLDDGRVIDVQHGQAVAVNPSSITVKSPDGFQAAYAINSHTMVDKAGKKSAIDQVKSGDRVAVIATRTGTTATADRIGDPGSAQQQPTPGPGK